MSAARSKGTAAETAVVRFLQSKGFARAERRALRGARDRGDVAGVGGVCIEVKDHSAPTEVTAPCGHKIRVQRLRLSEWVDEVAAEADPGGAGDLAAVWHKRRGRGSAGDWYVTMTGDMFARLLQEAGYQ